MADDKKKPEASLPNYFDEIVFFLAGLFILAVILNQLVNYLNSIGLSDYSSIWDYLVGYFLSLWPFWKVIAVILSAVFIIWAIYSLKKLREIDEEEKKIYGSKPNETLFTGLKEETAKKKENEKWARVREHAQSDNSSDWRLAIIEADIMLAELLRSEGYHGDTVGDMLKSAEGGGLINLEAAWEAHKIRNRIAHSGSAFQLNEREARRAIALFETVFKEFGIV